SIRHIASGAILDVEEVWLRDATFAVSQSGRLLALRRNRRTIHAGIIGTVLDVPPPRSPCDVVVNYHPRRDTEFRDQDDRPVYDAPLVHLAGTRVYIPRLGSWM